MKREKRIENGKVLQKLVANCKITGQGETVAADGGALVAKGILPEILSPNFSEGSLYSDCRIINVGEGKSGIRIPVALETTRSVTNIRGGYRAYVVKEGVAKTPSDGSFGVLDLALNKIAVVIPATDEIIQDAEALSAYMNDSAEEALKGVIDYSIVHGNGVMNAIKSSAATGFISLTDPLTWAELHNFFDAYYGGVNGKWYVSKVRFGQILDLYKTVAGGSILLTASEGKYYLFGYEMVVSDMMLDNDIMLADLTQYVIVQKEMTTAVNESLKFVEDEKYFRYVLRVNGGSIWQAPVTLADGSVVYPFVMLDTMENSSSSYSSQSNSSSSSSEWLNLSSSSSDSDSSGSSESISSNSSNSSESNSSESSS